MRHEVLILREFPLLTLLEGMTGGYDMTCWKKYLFVVPQKVYVHCSDAEDDMYEYYDEYRARVMAAEALSGLYQQAEASASTRTSAAKPVRFARHSSGMCFMFVKNRKTAIGTWLFCRRYFRKEVGARVGVKIVRKIMRVDERRFRVSFG